MSLSAVVISLLRAKSRESQVERIREQCPIHCDIWPATDGAAIPADEQARLYRPGIFHPAYPFTLRPGEIGCFVSHRRIWEKMVSEGIPQMLILEDDIDFLPEFQCALQSACANVPENGYVQFQVRDLAPQSSRVIGSGPYRLIQPTIVPLRTSAQLVTLGAAKRLLSCFQQFDRPVDAAIQLTWLHDAAVFTSATRSVVEVSESLGGSTIGIKSRRGWIASAQREWKRSCYRSRIASASRRHAA